MLPIYFLVDVKGYASIQIKLYCMLLSVFCLVTVTLLHCGASVTTTNS